MKHPNIPHNYNTVMPYLIVQGAAEFSAFAQKVFGARETHRAMRSEDVIMHAEIMIDECTIMFADSTEEYPPATGSFFIYVTDPDESFKKAIEAGASVIEVVKEQSYGRSGGVLDPFGNQWWITGVKKD